MHEFSLIESVLRTALQVAEEHGGARIERVSLRIGALQQVVPDALTFAYDAAVTGTLAEGSVLDWEAVPARVACAGCGKEYEPDDVFWLCPACGAQGGEVREGDELLLTSVELRDPDEP